MTKKMKLYSIFILFVFAAFVFLVNASNVGATSYDEGQYCMHFDLSGEVGDFPIGSITVNGNPWTGASDEYHSDDKNFTVVIKAGMDGEDYPELSIPGTQEFESMGGTKSAVPNPNEDPNVDGDEFLFTITINDTVYDSGNHIGEHNCLSFGGVGFHAGAPITNPSHNVTGNVSITISGDELEYHYVESEPDKADVTYFKFSINGGTEDERLVPFRFGNANYTHNDNPEPHNVSSVTTINPIEYTYPYNDTGEVEFCVNGGGTDEYTSLIINDHDYTNEVPHTKAEHWAAMDGWAQQFCFNIPYSENYVVSVEGEKVDDDYIIPGFGWSYLSSDKSDNVNPEDEGNFAHGKLQFVSATATIDNEELEFNSVSAFNNYRYHGTGQIFQWNDGNKDYDEADRRWAWGDCQLPVGTTLTVRIVPDRGYQLTRLAVSQNGFQATNIPGEYTITLNEENFSYNAADQRFDLNPTFEPVDATASTDSENLVGVHIDVVGGDDAFAAGTPKLQVSDVASMSQSREESFNQLAENDGYTINNYLELDLYNTIYKGGKTDNSNNLLSWDTAVHHLQNDATVNLQLNNQLEGSQVAVIHEIRDNNNDIVDYELIEGTYNANTKVVSFETNGFSTYAIAYKGDAPVVETATISFNSNGGSAVQSITVNKGETAERPDDPTNGDLIFGGWFLDDTWAVEFDFNEPLENDVEVIAKWDEPQSQSATLSFDSRGGTPIQPITVQKGETVDRPDDPENGEYVFGGWFLDDTWAVEYDFNDPLENDLEIVAKWDDPIPSEKVRVIFHTNTGGGDFDVEIDRGTAVEEPEDPNNGNSELLGWYSDEECTSLYDFSTPVTDDEIELFAKWGKKTVQNPEEYTVENDDEGIDLTFTEEQGHNFTLIIDNYMAMSEAELEAKGIDQATFNALIGIVGDTIEDYGELITVYDITIIDETNSDDYHYGPFTIRIAATDALKAYKNIRLIYLKDDMSAGDVVELTLSEDGTYYSGTLPHLSAYVLAGSNEEENSNTPKTGDNIMFYAGMLIVSALSAYGVMRFRKNN